MTEGTRESTQYFRYSYSEQRFQGWRRSLWSEFNSRNLPKTQNSDHRNENNSMKDPKRIKSSREAR